MSSASASSGAAAGAVQSPASVSVPERRVGDVVHGFRLERDEWLPDVRSHVRLYRHQQLGTELVSVTADDENKTFGVAFRTPPSDSRGVAHILEHSVLCGSRKYPVKEPFVELLKASLNTFLNAMTFPDKTCYPVASTNVADFYNLVDVYMDAVFFPRLTPDVLAQEGHHVELDDVHGEMSFKGVVYNEMKGVYSSPESVLMTRSQQVLFPDTVYGHESGGDPGEIPDLTWEQFQQFHERFYHPSNARLWFYGDDPEDMRLGKASEFLDDYIAMRQRQGKSLTVDVSASRIPLQPRFSAPRKVEFPYDADDKGKYLATVNWMLHGTTTEVDLERMMALLVLDHLLLGTSASPLRKALIDADIGEDVLGPGLETELLQMTYSVGMKGLASAATVDRMEEIVHDTLRSLADGALTEDLVLSSLNTVEFRLRENNTGAFPKGLALMLRSLTTWLHDDDPTKLLRFERPLQALRQRLQTGEDVFQQLIRRELLDNPHRVRVTLRPDPEMAKRMRAAERARLDALRAKMGEPELQSLVQDTQRLRAKQEAPDPPEALAKIPVLHVADLEPRVKTVPREVIREHADVQVLWHPLATNGVVYADIGLDWSRLPADLLPFMGIYAEALLEMGTQRQDYVSLQRRIGRYTGGIRPVVYVSQRVDERGRGAVVQRMFLRGKAMVNQTGDLLHIVSEVLNEPRWDNRERFRQLVMEEKAGLEARLVTSGHVVVANRLRAQYRVSDWMGEQMGGISYLRFLRQLLQRIDSDWESVASALTRVHQCVVARQGAVVNFTTDVYDEAVKPHLNEFLSSIPAATAASVDGPADTAGGAAAPLQPRNEALVLPAQVNYVGKGGNLYDVGYSITGASLLAAKHLGNGYLWENVRVKGGAYGGFCRLDPRTGTFVYLSYRDPNVDKTIEVYDQAPAHLQQLSLSREEVEKAIIGVIGDMDTYQLPDVKGYSSTLRYLTGETDELRQQRREQVLSARVEDFQKLGEALEEIRKRGSVVVLGGGDAIEKSRQRLQYDEVMNFSEL